MPESHIGLENRCDFRFSDPDNKIFFFPEVGLRQKSTVLAFQFNSQHWLQVFPKLKTAALTFFKSTDINQSNAHQKSNHPEIHTSVERESSADHLGSQTLELTCHIVSKSGDIIPGSTG